MTEWELIIIKPTKKRSAVQNIKKLHLKAALVRKLYKGPTQLSGHSLS